MEFPIEKDVGRYGDMSKFSHMRVSLDGDSDVIVSIYDENGGATAEFCTSAGGGKSPKTREALIALMVAIEADNLKDPSRDWWKRRC